MNNPLRHFPIQLALFLGVWLITLEILARIFLSSPAAFTADPDMGWRPQANSDSLVFNFDSGSAHVRTNALGFNDDEPGLKTRRRIAVLGDSYVEANQVPRAQNFLSLAERETGYQFVNLGRGGLNPATELALFENMTNELQPDAVVMVLNNGDGDDLLNARIMLSMCGQAGRVCGVRVMRSARSVVKLHLRPLMERSGLLTFLARRYSDLLEPRTINSIAAKLSRRAPRNTTGLTRLEADDVQAYLRYVFERIAARSTLVVVYLDEPLYGAHRQAILSRPDKMKDTIAGAAKEARATFLDAGPAFVEAYRQSGQPGFGFNFNRPGIGHLNSAGHAVLAHLVADAVRRSTTSVAQ